MSIRNILVAYNGTATSERALRLGAALSRRNDAHVTCLFAHTMPYVYSQMEAYMNQAALDIMAKHEHDAEDRVRERFDALIASEEPGLRIDFQCASGMPNDVLANYGRTYDLIVIGQPDPKEGTIYDAPTPDSIALQSGRPVLVAPRGYERMDISGGAVVAWDGKRAAARALSDAMGLLEQKDEITVLHVGAEDDVRQPGRDIMEHLSRHDIPANLVVTPRSNIDVSDVVLNTCAETDAGFLVMGAYEHSRFSEMLLGGVTRDVLSRTHIPILMAH